MNVSRSSVWRANLDPVVGSELTPWSAVTCHRFGPQRASASFRQPIRSRYAARDSSERPKRRQVGALQGVDPIVKV
jgi:hypothetical protein